MPLVVNGEKIYMQLKDTNTQVAKEWGEIAG